MFKKFVSILFGVMVMMSISVNSFAYCSYETRDLTASEKIEFTEKIAGVVESDDEDAIDYDELHIKPCVSGRWLVYFTDEHGVHVSRILNDFPTEEDIEELWAKSIELHNEFCD